jgi:chromosome segregation ATPase
VVEEVDEKWKRQNGELLAEVEDLRRQLADNRQAHEEVEEKVQSEIETLRKSLSFEQEERNLVDAEKSRLQNEVENLRESLEKRVAEEEANLSRVQSQKESAEKEFRQQVDELARSMKAAQTDKNRADQASVL